MFDHLHDYLFSWVDFKEYWKEYWHNDNWFDCFSPYYPDYHRSWSSPDGPPPCLKLSDKKRYLELQETYPGWFDRLEGLALRGEFPGGIKYPSQLENLHLQYGWPLQCTPFPTTLKHLSLIGYYGGDLILPPQLETLEIHHSPNLLRIESFPPTLRSLKLNFVTNLTELPSFPSTLQKIHLQSCQRLQGFPAWPPRLQSLWLSEITHTFELPPLPSSLQVLILDSLTLSSVPRWEADSCLKKIEMNSLVWDCLDLAFLEPAEFPQVSLPDQLQVLSLETIGPLRLLNLPDQLTTLVLNNFLLHPDLPPLPDSLQEIQMVGVQVSRLRGVTGYWPSALSSVSLIRLTGCQEIPPWSYLAGPIEQLTLNELPLEELPPFPRSVKELILDLQSLKKLPSLPRTLESFCGKLPQLQEAPSSFPMGLENLKGNLGTYPQIPPTLIDLFLTLQTRIHRLPYLPDHFWDSEHQASFGLNCQGFQVWEFCWWDQEVNLENLTGVQLQEWQSRAQQIQDFLTPFGEQVYYEEEELPQLKACWRDLIQLKEEIRIQIEGPLSITL